MIMKSKFLKIAGVSSEKEFYKKFPTEESFFAAHPEVREMKKGGSPEAFPQTITADNFFSYGVPAPPNYLKSGGMPNLYPQIQSEKQFFIPIYTNSPNAYAYGGMPEVFPQVGPVDYQPPVNMPLFMDEGGNATPPAEYPVSKGVNNTTGNFVSWLRNKSYSASEKEATKNAMGMMKNGGRNLPYMEPVRTVAQNGTQTSGGLTQDDFNKYMNAWFQSQMGQMQQPVYTDMRGFIPSMYAYNYDPRYKFTAKNAQGVMGKGTANMPLINAMFPELYSGSKSFSELMQDPSFKNRAATMGLTGYEERDRGLFGKKKQRSYTFGVPTQYNLDGQTGTGKLTVNSTPSLNNPSLSSTPPAQSNELPGPVTTPPAERGQFWKNWIPTLNQSAQSNDPDVSSSGSTFDPSNTQHRGAVVRAIIDGATPDGAPQYRYGGLHKAQGGFSFSPDDKAGDVPVNPMGVTPSTGLTEQQMRDVINDNSFGIKTTGKEDVTITEKEKGSMSDVFSNFYANQFYKRFATDLLNSRNQPDTFLVEDTITGIKPAMNFGQDPLSKKQMSNMFGNYAIQQDRGLYMKSGGQYSIGDEVEMTQEELDEFIQNGGQVDFI